MNSMSRLIHWLRQHIGPSPANDGPSHAAADLLASARQRFRLTDPETSLQWQRLEAALGMEGRAEMNHQRAPRRRIFRPVISFAIGVAVLIVAGVVWFQRPSTVVYETVRGQHSMITLPDSTVVTLNHTSELVVHSWSQGNARQVALNGEAFFNVRRNGTPFSVSTDVATIEVLGTEFNVRLRGERLEVGVLTGSVTVRVARNGRDSSVVLARGQIATCTRGEFPARPELLVVSGFPGWIHGKFMFYRTDLVSVCRELESQFDVAVSIETPRLRGETLTGVVDGRNIESALSTLATLTGSKFRHATNGYTMY